MGSWDGPILLKNIAVPDDDSSEGDGGSRQEWPTPNSKPPAVAANVDHLGPTLSVGPAAMLGPTVKSATRREKLWRCRPLQQPPVPD